VSLPFKLSVPLALHQHNSVPIQTATLEPQRLQHKDQTSPQMALISQTVEVAVVLQATPLVVVVLVVQEARTGLVVQAVVLVVLTVAVAAVLQMIRGAAQR